MSLSINSLSLAYSSSVLSMSWNVTGTPVVPAGSNYTIDRLNITATNTISNVSTNYNLTGYGGQSLNSYTVNVFNPPPPNATSKTATNIGTSVTIPIDATGLNLTVGQSYNFQVQAFGTIPATGPPFIPTQINSTVVSNSTNPVQIGNACFLKGTKILCPDGEIPIEELKKGMLVSTLYHGDVAVDMIGFNRMHHSRSLPITEQLYTYKNDDANNDEDKNNSLTVTGGHSRLVDKVNAREIQGILTYLHGMFVTDDKIRLPACLDEKASPYEKEEDDVMIYHICLEHPNDCLNYGIWANGRLMETCAKITLEKSMTIKID